MAEPLPSGSEGARFSTVLNTTSPPTQANPTPDGAGPATQALSALVRDTLDAGTRVDTMLAAVRRGKTFSPAELLGLQSDVFRYSQSVEVLSRTTDRLVGGLKQILNTQV